MQQLQKPQWGSLSWRLKTTHFPIITRTNRHIPRRGYSTNYTFNLYQVLGLQNNATQAQIKSAYYKLSKQYHPDRNKGSKSSQEMFSKINDAYSVLGNGKLRRRYDQGILTHRDRMGQQRHHSEATAPTGPRAREMGDQFTATFRSAHTENVIDEFLKKRYRANIDKHQEEKKYRQLRAEEYKKLQDRAQRTPFVLIALMCAGFAFGSFKLLGWVPFNESKFKQDSGKNNKIRRE
ncbi:hypothetical protein BSL78_18659 [Apostichopus japonicus]|uniref:J domain-containing protein n=1 Tax=Stichopus japonicus TaxID=307972 RepID=A0A2G8K919_STIJA|nr:hypothetical protein BSL78_18659 [Apostichopus japonicus]